MPKDGFRGNNRAVLVVNQPLIWAFRIMIERTFHKGELTADCTDSYPGKIRVGVSGYRVHELKMGC